MKEQIAFKLTNPELRKKTNHNCRFEKENIEQNILKDDFVLKFFVNDDKLYEPSQFVKTERAYSNFFVFTISVSGI